MRQAACTRNLVCSKRRVRVLNGSSYPENFSIDLLVLVRDRRGTTWVPPSMTVLHGTLYVTEHAVRRWALYAIQSLKWISYLYSLLIDYLYEGWAKSETPSYSSQYQLWCWNLTVQGAIFGQHQGPKSRFLKTGSARPEHVVVRSAKEVIGVLVFSALPFTAVQSLADSDFGKSLRVHADLTHLSFLVKLANIFE